MQTANTGECYHGRHTAGANVRREEGTNPDRRQGPSQRQVGTMWEGPKATMLA